MTRDVARHDVPDLADAPPRAHLSWVADGRPCVAAVVTRVNPDGTDDVGIAASAPGAQGLEGAEVHLVRDSGRWWFELRALVVRGTLRAHGGRADGLDWYRLTPTRTVAWDYGRLREVEDA